MNLKFYLFFLLSLFFSFSTIFCQEPNEQWVTNLGSDEQSRGTSVAIDNEGNIYTVGGYYGAATVDTESGSINLNSIGFTDGFLQKQTSDGTVLWVQSFGTGGFDFFNTIHIGSDGSVFVGGSFSGEINLSTQSGNQVITPNGETDAMLLNYTSGGELIWARTFGGLAEDEVTAITSDPRGRIYIAGNFSHTINLTTTTGPITFTADGALNGIVMKYTAGGDILWATSFGNGGFNSNEGISLDNDDNIYSFGDYRGSISFTSATETIELTSAGSSDFVLLKQNTDGEVLWAKSYGGEGFDNATGISVDPVGNSHIVGIFNTSVSMGSGYTLYSQGDADVVIAKVDTDGTTTWAKSFGSDKEDYANDITVDNVGNIYSTGHFYSEVEFGLGTNAISLTSNGQSDIFVYKQDSEGIPIFAKNYGGSAVDVGNAITVGNSGEIAVTGGFNGEVDFGGGAGVLTVNSFDAFTLKFGECVQTSGIDVQTACETYTWIDDNIYTSDNDNATFIIPNSVGCDSLVTLNLTINNADTGTDVQTACEEYTWIDGNTYRSNNNVATFLTETTAGCDSLITLDLTINNAASSTQEVETCIEYTWIDGNTYTTDNNTATFLLETTEGCDSLVTLDLTITNAASGTDVQTACVEYTWIDGNTYTIDNNSATFNIIGGSQAGCDSIVTLDLTINSPQVGVDVQTVCDALIWIDGNAYTEDNATATFNIIGGAENGCDSLVFLALTVVGNTTGVDTKQACGSYNWIDGNTYTADNNTATHTIEGGSEFGCDSIVTLDLTIVNQVEGTDIQTACNEFLWIDGNTYTEDNNTASFTFEDGSSNGCDSIVTLDLTVITQLEGIDTYEICAESFEWIDGNVYTSNNSTATFLIEEGSADGCDSLVTLNLTINQDSEGVDVQNKCESFIWIDGNTYTESNNTATFTIEGGSASGCDSIVVLNLTIGQVANEVDEITSCGPYTWIDGNTYASNNNTATFEILGEETGGCDTLVTLNLTVNQIARKTDVIEACQEFTWIDGNTYTEDNNTAMYTFPGGASNGCDSIVSLDLDITTLVTSTDTNVSCDMFTWINGRTYFEANNTDTYLFEGGSANGCDSLVTLDLTINYSTNGIDYVEACDSFTWINGVTYTNDNNSDTYTIVGGSKDGCDSIAILNLIINDTGKGRDTQIACDEFTWIDGITYTESNSTAKITIKNGSINGCDSIVTLNLTINEVSDVSITIDEPTITANNSNPGVTYQWVDCNFGFSEIFGETGQSFTPKNSGNYAVVITENGCSSMSDCTEIIVSSTEVTDFNNKFLLYPNPTNKDFNILFEEQQEEVEVSILSVDGKVLQQNIFNFRNSFHLNIEDEPSGVYFIKIKTATNIQMRRIVKK